MKKTAIGAILVTAAAVALGFSLRPKGLPDPLPGFPRIVLWAWERPEDLRFVKPETAGIAFLARTVWLDPQHVASRPRLQPLRFPPGATLIAVVRLESRGHGLPSRADVIREIQPATTIPGVRALQIDFDARASERAWYRALLNDLRAALPPDKSLLMTALASWCESDDWLRGLPVADATPMLFRMGGEDRVRSMDFKLPLCASSLGVATDELPSQAPAGRRLYFFSPHSWTPQSYEAAVSQARRWQR